MANTNYQNCEWGCLGPSSLADLSGEWSCMTELNRNSPTNRRTGRYNKLFFFLSHSFRIACYAAKADQYIHVLGRVDAALLFATSSTELLKGGKCSCIHPTACITQPKAGLRSWCSRNIDMREGRKERVWVCLMALRGFSEELGRQAVY